MGIPVAVADNDHAGAEVGHDFHIRELGVPSARDVAHCLAHIPPGCLHRFFWIISFKVPCGIPTPFPWPADRPGPPKWR